MESSSLDLFSRFSLTAKTKIVVLGMSFPQSGKLTSQDRSLTLIEHVSLATLLRPEISRSSSTSATVAAESPTAFALLRKWFWARKPDAGFILFDFPATLLQALIFDEWLEARNETLDAVWIGRDSKLSSQLVEHYRDYGLITKNLISASEV